MADARGATQRKLALLSALIGILGALVLAEIAVRVLLGHQSPDTVREHSLTYRQVSYARFLLEPVDRLVDVSSEKAWGGNPDGAPDRGYFISASGYRGPAFAPDKPAGVYRIVVVGGSAVFDQNVFDTPERAAGTWPHKVGDALAAAGLTGVEVINAGVPGANSADALGRVFAQLWMYAPDMLVLYHGWNDVKYWHRQGITPDRPLIEQLRPWDPTDNPLMYYRGPLDRFLSHSQLYMRARNRYYLRQLRPDAEGAADAPAALASDYGPYGPRQFALNLTLFVEAARAVRATPVIVTQATLAVSGNSEADTARIRLDFQHLDHAAVVRAMDETRRIGVEVAARTGALLVDPAARMNGRSEWFTDAVHLTPAGSDELARLVAEALRDTVAAAVAAP